MKTHTSILWVCLLLIGFATGGCQREVNIDLDKGFSSQIQQIVPQAIIDTLRSKGMTINEGLVPPQLSGIYVASPFYLMARYGPDDNYPLGKIIPDQYYKFYNQTVDNAITYDYAQADKVDIGNGKGAFIGGNGNKFTIFSENVGVAASIPYKQLTIVTGELTAQGIKDFQYAFVMKDKTGDATNNVLIAVGKSRIWRDNDKLASKTTYYPQFTSPAVREARAGEAGSFSANSSPGAIR